MSRQHGDVPEQCPAPSHLFSRLQFCKLLGFEISRGPGARLENVRLRQHCRPRHLEVPLVCFFCTCSSLGLQVLHVVSFFVAKNINSFKTQTLTEMLGFGMDIMLCGQSPSPLITSEVCSRIGRDAVQEEGASARDLSVILESLQRRTDTLAPLFAALRETVPLE